MPNKWVPELLTEMMLVIWQLEQKYAGVDRPAANKFWQEVADDMNETPLTPETTEMTYKGVSAQKEKLVKERKERVRLQQEKVARAKAQVIQREQRRMQSEKEVARLKARIAAFEAVLPETLWPKEIGEEESDHNMEIDGEVEHADEDGRTNKMVKLELGIKKEQPKHKDSDEESSDSDDESSDESDVEAAK